MSDSESRSLFDAEAFAAVERAQAAAKQTERTLAEAAAVLLRSGHSRLSDCEKVQELHRLVSVRLDVFARRLADGEFAE